MAKGENGLWVIGLVLCTLAAVCNALGIIVLKVAHNYSGCKGWCVWVSGNALMFCTAIFDFAAFAFAAQSLIASVGAFSLVCNALLSPIILGEKVTNTDYICATVVTGGCILAISFGNHNTTSYTIDELVGMFDNVAVYVFFVIIALSTGLLSVFLTVIEDEAQAAITDNMVARVNMALELERKEKEMQHASARVGAIEHDHAYTETEGGGDSDIDEEAEAEKREARLMIMGMKQRYHMPHCLAYGYIGGIYGACSVLFGKTTVECIKNGLPAFATYQLWVFMLTMIGALLLQLRFLNTGIKYHDVMLVLPIYMTAWILGGVLGGSIYFQEFAAFSGLQVAMFSVGIASGISGIAYLTYARVKSSQIVKSRRQSRADSYVSEEEEKQGRSRGLSQVPQEEEDLNKLSKVNSNLSDDVGLPGTPTLRPGSRQGLPPLGQSPPTSVSAVHCGEISASPLQGLQMGSVAMPNTSRSSDSTSPIPLQPSPAPMMPAMMPGASDQHVAYVGDDGSYHR